MRLHPFKKWRTGQGLSQNEMAEKIGTTQARVCKFERGEIFRLEPEQAYKAEEISQRAITADDCLKRTPAALAAARRSRARRTS
jgi:transcriptional regulator with XRE-family HTH domain